jgi:hypothetical protein
MLSRVNELLKDVPIITLKCQDLSLFSSIILTPSQMHSMAYFMGATPRSLHIFRAKLSLISECLGMEERLFKVGLCHQECLPPSLKNSQP